MKAITVSASEALIRQLSDEIATKKMVGSFYGFGDEILLALRNALHGGEDLVLRLKKEQARSGRDSM